MPAKESHRSSRPSRSCESSIANDGNPSTRNHGETGKPRGKNSKPIIHQALSPLDTNRKLTSSTYHENQSTRPHKKSPTPKHHHDKDEPTKSNRKSSLKSKGKSTTKSQHDSTGTDGESSTSPRRRRAPSELLVTYLEDTTHTNPGYSTTYTNGLIYTCGFPEEPDAQQDLESEIVREAEARIQGSVNQYGDGIGYD
ncbi:hypothetical protein BGZ60DRAFT_535414 [Tricladium varicosporioides]|nr:hypothetical protein BGZ60DRAFT_535414 [Hymenoscyphus varicosporioides]